ncbi:MAG: hypothetical protein AB8G14_00375 [Ilumatobacter sp.]
MGVLAILLRRSVLLILLTAVGGVAWSWRRDQADGDLHDAPQWPPLDPPTGDSSADDPAEPPTTTPAATTPAATTPAATPAAPTNSAASFVNALVDAPEARSRDGEAGGWTDPLDDGSCPLSHPVKANDNSGIFHVPEGRFYARTNPERCYSDADAAIADGYRQAKH